MKGILIDPFEKEVTLVEVDPGIKAIYSLIGQDCFDVVRIDSDTLYVDDEGLFRLPQRYFKLSTYSQPLGGKALLLGVNESGESTDVTHTVSDILSMIDWVRPDFQYSHTEESSGVADNPIFGKVNFIKREAIFKDKDGNEYR